MEGEKERPHSRAAQGSAPGPRWAAQGSSSRGQPAESLLQHLGEDRHATRLSQLSSIDSAISVESLHLFNVHDDKKPVDITESDTWISLQMVHNNTVFTTDGWQLVNLLWINWWYISLVLSLLTQDLVKIYWTRNDGLHKYVVMKFFCRKEFWKHHSENISFRFTFLRKMWVHSKL